MKPQLLLLGGGHAHVQVLAELARQPIPGWQVRLVTPYRRQIYSGMLPGWIAGHYPLDDCAIDLDALAKQAGVELLETACTGLDADAKQLQCANGEQLTFDRLSIDTGPVAALQDLPGAVEHALPIRPIEGFVAAWPALVARIAAREGRFELLLAGAGAAGVELAFAFKQRAQTEGWQQLRISLIGSTALPLDGLPTAARRSALALLQQRGIRWLGDSRVARISADHVELQSGAQLPSDLALLLTGAAAPAWPRLGGLSTDEGGFIRVGTSLQSLSHPSICAAGDVAAYASARPKSGVYAVRAGPVLAANLRALCEGHAPRDWTPQRRALYLISTGDRHAIANWGPLHCSGAWVWRWKHRIDHSFMQRYRVEESPHRDGKR
ncbi:FAD-dependent oxidoreductase [Roseateles sp.]|jgi:pyridine nucleotide-disulfide oxidoreductase family protein|uniref:FAD-dependent oxidoreductase n=1 Tax=Roseateles sp. TaxID=1971397 RepID=UPI0037C7E1D1